MYYGYGYGMGYHFDWTIILVLIGALVSGIASINVNRTYSKYSRVGNYRGLTSNQVAEHILHCSQCSAWLVCSNDLTKAS